MTLLEGSLGVALSLVLMQCHVLIWHRCMGISGLGFGLGLFGPVHLGLVQLERVFLVLLGRLGLLGWLGLSSIGSSCGLALGDWIFQLLCGRHWP